ncbi:hypothetical protein AMK68_00245 [candidate division KD3-62 bacterium DG_56]|uniref:HTH cro/C1-type domain-containing protein n=1 Tax=candidate division KD3-62 bacterium DG_56 TaxID=1704032 RepID=A0A0S7XQX6_9BACT|nr:MAG: hypothetical protein AMK68_00245 [candidate division KD3-62 bacterium DG_56]
MPTLTRRNDLQALIKAKGLSQSQVAERCAVTDHHLSDVLCGRAALTRRLARLLSFATGIPLAVILPPGDGEKGA